MSGGLVVFCVCVVCVFVCCAFQQSKVKSKIIKKFIQTMKISRAKGRKSVAKDAAGEVDASAANEIDASGELLPPLPPPASPAPADDCPSMKGMMVRCIDEGLGRSVCGQVLEILSNTHTTVFGRVQMQGSGFGKNVGMKLTQIIDVMGLSERKPIKKMQMTYETRVELDYKFNCEELGKMDFTKDVRFAGMHLDIGWWVIARDLELDSCSKIAFISPDLTACVVNEIQLADGAEAACRASAQYVALIQDAEIILVPVWGGTGGSQHWSLLDLEKIEGSWKVFYKDSLSSGMSKDCRANASKILFVLSIALNENFSMPDEICNRAFQPKGSGLCGQFVIHWCDEAARRCIGEGQMANGFPDHVKWTHRVQSVVDQIVKNSGISKAKILKSTKKKDELDKQAADAIELIRKIAEDVKFQKISQMRPSQPTLSMVVGAAREDAPSAGMQDSVRRAAIQIRLKQGKEQSRCLQIEKARLPLKVNLFKKNTKLVSNMCTQKLQLSEVFQTSRAVRNLLAARCTVANNIDRQHSKHVSMLSV